ncbi:MAG: hypothetical protein GY757_30855 [bacterium]|nr:hypothetical protein [bacterium]
MAPPDAGYLFPTTTSSHHHRRDRIKKDKNALQALINVCCEINKSADNPAHLHNPWNLVHLFPRNATDHYPVQTLFSTL